MKNILLTLTICLISITAFAQTNTISGNIVLDSNKRGRTHDSFMVWLIAFDSSTNILSAVDSQLIINFRDYSFPFSFSNKPSGQYRLKASWGPYSPKNIQGPMPTYHDSSTMWNNAQLINHTGGTSSGANIHMRYGNVPNGPGFISGNVLQGANKGTTNGIADMNIFLLDTQDNPVAFTTTDANGDYSFSNITYGTYKIHPENLGDATTAAPILLNAANSTVNNILFERSNKDKTIKPKPTSVSLIDNVSSSFKVYPNPATDNISISWNTISTNAATITITDISGKTVYSAEQSMSTTTTINLAYLEAGLYFLTVENNHSNNTQKVIIK